MFDQILQEIKKFNNIIILRHQNPDPDAIGSQLGLANILRENFPDKNIYTPGTDLEVFDWLGKMQTIDADLYRDALIIAVDTANKIRIDDQPYFENSPEIIKIDHHPNDDPFGKINLVEDSYSSCAELIFTFATETGLEISKETARQLYAGIIGDTNRFLYAETSARTLSVAAELAKTGIDLSEISHHEDEMTLEIARLEAYILENVTLNDSGFGYIILRKNILDIFNLNPGELDYAVPLIGKIDEVKTWVVISEKEPNHFRCNLRSKAIPINDIAVAFGGGGHPLASGVYVHNMDNVQRLLDEMEKITK
jgi:phosphoesterase RecJ-like protein